MMRKEVPTYRKKGLFGRMKALFRNPLNFSAEVRQELGDFAKVDLGFRTIYLVSNPAAIKHILQTNNKRYGKSPAYEQLKLALGNGLVTSKGDFWRKQRRLAQPSFHKKRLEELFAGMVEETSKYLERLEARKDRESPTDICEEMAKITATIVLRTLFSADNKANLKLLYETINEAQEYVLYRTNYPFLIPFCYLNGRHRKFKKQLKVFDDIIYEIINQRKESTEQPADLLSMLLRARDEETGEGMSDQQLRDEVITLFVAGHETSANALSWAWYALAKNPAVKMKLRAEIAAVLGDRMPSFDDLKALPYTKQVLAETMRLYPPAWVVGRESLAADEINGWPIQKKEIFLLNIHALHRHPDFWEDPERFDPERFAVENVKTMSRQSYLPFGSGPRMCIGNHFAMMEMQLLLATLVRKFDFTLSDGHTVTGVPLIVYKPKGGIPVHITGVQS